MASRQKRHATCLEPQLKTSAAVLVCTFFRPRMQATPSLGRSLRFRARDLLDVTTDTGTTDTGTTNTGTTDTRTLAAVGWSSRGHLAVVADVACGSIVCSPSPTSTVSEAEEPPSATKIHNPPSDEGRPSPAARTFPQPHQPWPPSLHGAQASPPPPFWSAPPPSSSTFLMTNDASPTGPRRPRRMAALSWGRRRNGQGFLQGRLRAQDE